jgi:hypothetical protein
MEDSMGFKNVKVASSSVGQLNGSQLNESRVTNMGVAEDPLMQASIRKPGFSQSGTIGGLFGFRKKDDKAKIFG